MEYALISGGTALLWWKFYEDYEKHHQLHQAFSETFNETSKTTSETLNETFYQTNETVNETFSSRVRQADEFQAKDTVDSMFLPLAIIASLLTVRCHLCTVLAALFDHVTICCLLICYCTVFTI